MKIFSAEQIRQWDEYTILNEPITSVDLMERAAEACFHWIMGQCDHAATFTIICGSGNNGGDGLAIARMLHEAKLHVKVYILKADKRTPDCVTNLNRLMSFSVPLREVETEKDFPAITSQNIVVDALFGTGLNKPLNELAEKLVQYINASDAEVISIDIPSGLFADGSSHENTVMKAAHTLSFQINKLAFMFGENENCTGTIHLLDIGLDKTFYQDTKNTFATIDEASIHSIYQPRKKFTHKYSYGHALMYAGSNNMMGAAILCAAACLRSGAGLVTVHTKEDGASVIQSALPEALTSTEKDLDRITKKKTAIGIGPGLELTELNSALLKAVITTWHGPLVIDASALHLLTPFLHLLSQRQNNAAILTPHTGEFEKLFGKTNNDFERMQLAREKATQHNCYIILKGPNSLVACPDGEGYFNTTGNSGMATAGSGDVLTGILTGLLAQGYTQKEAGIMGVYLHGLAGDIGAGKHSKEAMIASDITDNLGAAFKTFC